MRSSHRRARMSYDAAGDSVEFQNHWASADSLDADCANNLSVRRKLRNRSRYEAGSNPYYKGILRTYCNSLVGTGPSLRMLSKNRDFNQLVEREWFKWTHEVHLSRKLWSMAYAKTTDGEAFAVLQTNPALPGVQLDFMPIEAEQVHSPYVPHDEPGYVDGIKYDEHGNIEWYDVLPYHPGSNYAFANQDPIRVPPQNVLHWFRSERPGTHRGVPECTSALNTGASSRRHREATITAAEHAADLAALIMTDLPPNGEADLASPFTSVDFERGQLTSLPMGWKAEQMEGKHPNAQYADFHRLQISEQGRPLELPYNLASCDSSTYSFASGKLDTICFRKRLDVERGDGDLMVMDRLFAAWFREWTVLTGNVFTPAHQWDWPAHPVIDAVQEANARRTELHDGTLTYRQVMSDKGQDYEDHLTIQAEDIFGEADDENIAKVRLINLLRTTPQHAIQYVAAVVGIELPSAAAPQPSQPKPMEVNEDDTVVV